MEGKFLLNLQISKRDEIGTQISVIQSKNLKYPKQKSCTCAKISFELDSSACDGKS